MANQVDNNLTLGRDKSTHQHYQYSSTVKSTVQSRLEQQNAAEIRRKEAENRKQQREFEKQLRRDRKKEEEQLQADTLKFLSTKYNIEVANAEELHRLQKQLEDKLALAKSSDQKNLLKEQLKDIDSLNKNLAYHKASLDSKYEKERDKNARKQAQELEQYKAKLARDNDKKSEQASRQIAVIQYQKASASQKALLKENQMESLKQLRERNKLEIESNKFLIQDSAKERESLGKQISTYYQQVSQLKKLQKDKSQAVNSGADTSAIDKDIKHLQSLIDSTDIEQLKSDQTEHLKKESHLQDRNAVLDKDNDMMRREIQLATKEWSTQTRLAINSKGNGTGNVSGKLETVQASGLNDITGMSTVAKNSQAKIDQRMEIRQDALAKLQEAYENGDDEQIEFAKKQLEASEEGLQQDMLANNMAQMSSNLLASIDQGIANLGKAVDNRMTEILTTSSEMAVYLRGTGESYKDILNDVTNNIGVSPIFKQTEVLASIANLVKQGVTYNASYRGFLNKAADKVAATFNADSNSLLRIIRLQQADTTAARLGMEAFLTSNFNHLFQNTEYLKGTFDSIQGSLEEVLSTMNNSQGAEFEYIVQKWLGSMYSVGLSDNTASMIAQALNYLGTGDVNSLTGNQQMLTLLGLSADKAGLDLGDLLLNGLNASTTNDLLKSMVDYLREIADSENNVVKSAYGNVLNISMSDLRAVSNLSDSDVKGIYDDVLSYSGMNKTLQNALSLPNLMSITSIPEMMENAFDNVTTTISEGIANNAPLYALYKLNNLLLDTTGGINVPFINAFGTGVDLNANINQLLNLSMMGAGMLSNVGSILGAAMSGGYRDATNWGNYSDYTVRGTGLGGLSEGSQSGTSQSTQVTNSSGSDIKNSTLSDSADDAEESGKYTNKNNNMDDEKTTTDIYHALFEDDSFYVKADVINMEQDYANKLITCIRLALDDTPVQVTTNLKAIADVPLSEPILSAYTKIVNDNAIDVNVTNNVDVGSVPVVQVTNANNSVLNVTGSVEATTTPSTSAASSSTNVVITGWNVDSIKVKPDPNAVFVTKADKVTAMVSAGSDNIKSTSGSGLSSEQLQSILKNTFKTTASGTLSVQLDDIGVTANNTLASLIKGNSPTKF